MRTVVVTLIAEDRAGLVAELAGTVAEQGGNWLESQMGGSVASSPARSWSSSRTTGSRG